MLKRFWRWLFGDPEPDTSMKMSDAWLAERMRVRREDATIEPQ
jgi:hypothetical protein